MEYRNLEIDEVDKIKEIDATYYIKNAWRKVNGEYKLVEINWTDYELPNGLPWHLEHFRNTLMNGGYAFGCFNNNILIGYCTLERDIFGVSSKYVLLDQLFVSKDFRNKRVGRHLVSMCMEQARKIGADKLFICAGSSENTIAFYKKIGCVDADEVRQDLYEEDPRDIQLELDFLNGNEGE